MDKSKNSEELNLYHKNNLNHHNKIIQNEKEEDNEIIIELEIFNNKNKNEINILCDKDRLKQDNKKYYNENNIEPPKEFNYFNKNNTKLYLNDKKIEFNYKLR